MRLVCCIVYVRAFKTILSSDGSLFFMLFYAGASALRSLFVVFPLLLLLCSEIVIIYEYLRSCKYFFKPFFLPTWIAVLILEKKQDGGCFLWGLVLAGSWLHF